MTAQQGQIIRQGGANRPLALDEAGAVWRIVAGHADLFAEAPGGLRLHVARLETGALMFAAAPASEVRLVAVGGLGSAFARRPAGAEFDPHDHIAAETWVEALARAVAGSGGAGWPDALLPDAPAALPPAAQLPGGVCAPPARSMTVVAVAGALHWPPEGAPLPEGPVALAGPMRLRPGAGGARLEPCALSGAAVAATTAAALDRLALRLAEDDRAEAARLDQGSQLATEELARALDSLMAGQSAPPPERLGLDGWTYAAALAMRACGLPLPSEQLRKLARETPPDGPMQLAARLGLPARPVHLVDGWWRQDGLPLIGRDVDGQPLALLPDGRGGWRAQGQGVAWRVHAPEAARIAPDAVQLYPTLPDGSIGLWRFMSFGLAGTGDERRRILLTVVGAAALVAGVPLLTRVLFNNVVPVGDLGNLGFLLLALAALAIGRAGFELTRAMCLARLEARLDARLQAAVFARMIHLPGDFFRHYPSAILARRTLGLQEIRMLATSSTLAGIFGLVGALTSGAVLVWTSWTLALAGLVPVLLLVALTAWLMIRQLAHRLVRAHEHGQTHSFVLQMLLGMGKLRVAHAEARALGEWAWRAARTREAHGRARVYQTLFTAVQKALPWLSMMVVYAAAVLIDRRMAQATEAGMAAGPLLTSGTFLAFSTAFGQLTAALGAASAALAQAVSLAPMLERTRPIREAVPERPPGLQSQGPRLAGQVSLRGVRFRYGSDGPAVLHDVSFDVAPGEFVAIVGPSGSGKSTLMRLLLGFDTPTVGEILFDGTPSHGFDPVALRRQIGTVLQGAAITAGSIGTNILGGSGHDLSDAWAAARLVGLAEDIEAMPMGMHTVLQDGGGTLSGGQRQRILIARALVRRPALLLLDEATSALDNRTQAIVTRTLADLAVSRIVIAHRLSTIRQADRIVVLEAGRVVETGTYEELMTAGGLFAGMARRQRLEEA